ncbi:fatty-acid peroxygenase [Lutimaribacter pacificus]|uniref:Fatty-acid peroxygenase n=1 Tax=Lutimaribacter pacificus TaxID=391948 RepID=A0A1H0LVK3_9RHOB|nr:cytochrome P450 [Lutimaribacter pacificus]SDO72207.1 fatty-acid peroxygenase [Lutimaribacter pacificus]SHK02704.1 fatty-acid peroxygenase [Lutimaribacter pacificus]
MHLLSESSSIPKLDRFDSTFDFLQEGYDFIGNRCRSLRTDAFQTRLMLRPVTCVRGPAAVEMFYAPGRLTRRGAMPATVVSLLQDRCSVQMLDGEAHRLRKAMFLDMMVPDRLYQARLMLSDELDQTMRPYRGQSVELRRIINLVMCHVAFRWCGLELRREDMQARCEDLCAMIDSVGSLGPRRARAAWLRMRGERWARRRIAQVRREGETRGWAIDRLAEHRDIDRSPMPDSVCAVELLNLLRPIVAVGRYIVFAIHALQTNPAAAAALRQDQSDAALENFCDEVRRLYPFFPVIGGRVLEPFEWRDTAFAENDWLLLDLYGTCRDPSAWTEPHRFDPCRLADRQPPTSLVPQGGGPMKTGHRCPGERLTRALLAEGVGFFLNLDYSVPPQNLEIRHDTIPPWPRDGMRIHVAAQSSGPF